MTSKSNNLKYFPNTTRECRFFFFCYAVETFYTVYIVLMEHRLFWKQHMIHIFCVYILISVNKTVTAFFKSSIRLCFSSSLKIFQRVQRSFTFRCEYLLYVVHSWHLLIIIELGRNNFRAEVMSGSMCSFPPTLFYVWGHDTKCLSLTADLVADRGWNTVSLTSFWPSFLDTYYYHLSLNFHLSSLNWRHKEKWGSFMYT